MAEYTSPVGERLWHATATATTPPQLLDTLLTSLADSDTPAPDSALTAKAVAVTIRALGDTDWTPAVDDRRMRWSAPGNSGGVEFDAHAAQSPTRPIPTWTTWGGEDINQPRWAVHLSADTPPRILQELSLELARGLEPRTQNRLASTNRHQPSPAHAQTSPTLSGQRRRHH
ncbi:MULTISPECIES: DUF317 domain-containing protein [Streptomyces]|uniref:DUF317 domain-containing protein n=1 Tax=Streptomyces TaxID=1883 RepID=UPI003409395F